MLNFTALATLAVSAFALPATAQDAPRRVEVSLSGVDLASADGRAQLERRIAAAANRVCAEPGVRDLASKMKAAECRKTALQAARQDMATLIARTQLAAR